MESSISMSSTTNYESISQINLKEKNELNDNFSDLFILSTSKIINEEIERVWLFFSDPFYFTKIYPDKIEKFKSKRKFSFLSIGDCYSFYWIGLANITYSCIYIENSDEQKKTISFEVNSSIDISFRKTYYLYKTSDNKTLVKIILTKISSDKFNKEINFDSFKEFCSEIYSVLLKKMNKFIIISKEYKVNYGSFIINNSYLYTWKEITNLKKLCTYIPEIGKNFIYKGDIFKKGTFIKYTKENKTNYFIVKNIFQNKKRNKWIYSIETFGSDRHLIKKNIQIGVTKINDNRTLVSLTQIFLSYINKEKYDNFQIELNNILELIKNYLSKKKINQ